MARFGAYELLERIGVGGMGEIFLAVLRREGSFEKLLVIKRILPSLSRDPDFVGMFHREARIAALLNHQNVVQVYDYGKEGDEYFIAMELVEGADLRSLLEQLGRPTRPAAATILRAVARALDYAHRLRDRRTGECLQLVHRDVSPGNVLISREGEVKLTDFGLVASGHAGHETDGGTLKGKYAYMSPEQTYSDPLDARSDLFSWGILAYELFEGRRPFEGEVPELVEAIRARDFVPMASGDLPDELVALVHQCLALHPDERPADAAEVAERLERIIAEQDWLDGERALCDWARPVCRDGAALRGDSDALATAVGQAPIRSGSEPAVAAEAVAGEAPGSEPDSEPESDDDANVAVAVAGRPKWVAAIALAGTVAVALALLAALNADPGAAGQGSGTSATRPTPDASRDLGVAADAVAPVARPVALRVRSRPAGAAISVAGRDLGLAPVLLEGLDPSEPVVVTGHLDGYEPTAQTVRPGDLPSLDGDERTRVLELSHTPMPATLEVTSEPAGVEVSLGDDVLGRTPVAVATDLVGSQPLTFQAEGYRSVSITVDLERGHTTRHHEDMTRVLDISFSGTPRGARAEIRSAAGETGACETPCNLSFDASPFEWEVRAEGFASARGSSDGSANAPISFALEPARRALQAQWRGGEGVSVRAGRQRLEPGESAEQSVSFAIESLGVTGSVLARYDVDAQGESADLTVRVAVSPSWARVELAGGGEAGTPCELSARSLGEGAHELSIQPSGADESYRLVLRLREVDG